MVSVHSCTIKKNVTGVIQVVLKQNLGIIVCRLLGILACLDCCLRCFCGKSFSGLKVLLCYRLVDEGFPVRTLIRMMSLLVIQYKAFYTRVL